MQNFIKELTTYLENTLDKKKTEMPIIEEILSKNSVTTGNENAIRWKFDEVVLKYAEQNFIGDSMYIVQDSKRKYWLGNKEHYDNNVYSVLKVENNQIEEIEINKKNMPKDIGVNDVFRIKDSEYIIEKLASEELEEEIENMAKEIIDKQNAKLNSYRKEGHLYMVSQEIGNNRFLWDLTDALEFEEIDIPKTLLDRATEGAVLIYTNGTYKYYSNDGFERVEKIYSSK